MSKQIQLFKYLSNFSIVLLLAVGLVSCKGKSKSAFDKQREQRKQEIQDLKDKMNNLVEEIENDPEIGEGDKGEWRMEVKSTLDTIRQLELEALQDKLVELKNQNEKSKKQEGRAKKEESLRVKFASKRYNKKLQRWIELFIEFRIKRKY
jgi:formate-dependent nitrite reductase cytochrome c552 subunit